MSDHNQTKLKDAIKAMLDYYKLKGKYQQTRIKQLWGELMGPAISQYTTDIKVYRKKLYVQLSSAPLKQELSMGTEKIRLMLNDELGEDYLEEVIIR
ncbi:MAG: DUF721 domain-containing protein [Bacteroidota bacterium]